ncbi:MAG: cyclic nucleotide-binding domain-containing protein, partial [Leptospiraceae bacterium]|nr:cyclic nucleotide-binding domain-containing protein [Leptospiraceae bacterium]
TIGFSWENRFGEVIGYYAADTQLSESELDKMVSEGAMTTERKKKLLSLPKNAEIYIIENGIPPLHTDGDTLSKLPDYILDNLFLVHTSKYPTLSNGKVWDYPTLAKSGMTVDTRPRTGRSTDIKKRITVEHILDFAKIPFFRNMKFTPEELALIEREVEGVYYKDGDVICKKDDPADSIYFMLEGGYQILPEGIEYQNKQKIMDARENRNDLIILGTPGAIMGESIAYKSRGRQKRTATVVAYGGRTSFLRFSKESFIRLMESDTDIGKLLRRMLEFKLKGIDNAFLNLEILRDLDSEEVRTFVAQKAHKTSFNKGEKLISEGATLKRLYILTDTNREEGVYLKQSQKSSSGKLLDGEKIFLTDHLLTSGCFGEQSIITGEPAVCDVVASGHLEVYYLKKADVLRMVKKYPAVQARIFQKIAKDRKDNADLHSQVSSIAETVVEHLKIEEDDSIGGF